MSSITIMNAVHYERPFLVSVREIPVPKIEHPDDVVIKVTTVGTMCTGEGRHFLADCTCTATCGSDLHMYQGSTAAESGLVLVSFYA